MEQWGSVLQVVIANEYVLNYSDDGDIHCLAVKSHSMNYAIMVWRMKQGLLEVGLKLFQQWALHWIC